MGPPKSVAPKGWPPAVTYIVAPLYSRACSPELINQLHTPPAQPTPLRPPPAPSPLVRVTQISDPSHPAHGQHGLFASRHLAPDTFVILYLGLVHTRTDADPASDYDLSLDRELGIGVDATRIGNEARFINDYRGVGPPGPNAEFRELWVDLGRGGLEKRMGVFVLSAGKSGKRAKGIAKGDEILVSYGKGFWSERRKEQEGESESSPATQ
ncbi:set domain-containing protein [Diplodia corticola]|uniref:Set domain-containing protein n=1 Tax=Diplodia corticola TaxID=236234 RepID=A0A1J9RAB5_9PEZI|nr:set domain-containing protein [Diplodia corticola]OJD37114.1 set domain-containing protein [Diplodia corticola]